MDKLVIASLCDHTLLAQNSTWEQIKRICDDGIKYKTASVCIPPCFVRRAKEYVGDGVKICTVIGFPNGYNKTSVKAFEAREALSDGADEIDMVINIGELHAGNADFVTGEIMALKEICGEKTLKVIIETCLLSEDEKILACKCVTEAGADFIKTSTGFSKSGATLEDVRLLRANVGKGVKVKAAGGITGLDDAAEFIKAGADRLGTSRVIKALKETEK